ncbi:MAG: tRNA pseudouridine(55) synthase TruB [Planctomycetes bacterium]|nr:tRNA pseudouridine(55) synthase TruB [Planctomycetota bacterium]
MNEEPNFPQLLSSFRENPLALLWEVPGVFPVNKPEGMTSHDVVSICRKQLNMHKVGHGGTLDPMAEGLLLILTGRATRLFDSMQEFTKTYVAELKLGERTDTHDRTGTIIEGGNATLLPLERALLEKALQKYRGEIEQIPPMFSAVKVDGKKLYRLARKGEVIEREPRTVNVYELELKEFDGVNATLEMTVSKGFYVRTLIDDIGNDLGTGAVMTRLVRTASGPFKLSDTIAPGEIGARREKYLQEKAGA